MNVNNNFDGPRQVFSSQELTRLQNEGKASHPREFSERREDEATLSPASSLAAQTASDSDFRLNKVIQIQRLLAEGSYCVPTFEVADMIIDQMQRNRK